MCFYKNINFDFSKEFLYLQDAKKIKKKEKDIDKKRRDAQMNSKNKEIQSHYAFNKPAIPPVSYRIISFHIKYNLVLPNTIR